MEMDVVYLCRPGDNEELRYSLRSLRNLPHRRVWIFGDAPRWVNDYHLAIRRIPKDGNKHRTTNITMRAACQEAGVTDPFVYMNDDFYITQPITEIPTLNLGPIYKVAEAYSWQGIKGMYVRGMLRTATKLESLGYNNPLSFETHTPLVVHKEHMLRALDLGPYHRRSVYGAFARLTGQTIRDVKVHKTGQTIPDGPFLSGMDTTLQYLKPHLEHLFPTTGQYELT